MPAAGAWLGPTDAWLGPNGRGSLSCKCTVSKYSEMETFLVCVRAACALNGTCSLSKNHWPPRSSVWKSAGWAW